MESRYYETIHETGHLQVRFEPVFSPAGVFPAHWHEYVEILYIKEGLLSAIVQAAEYTLHANDLLIVNSGDLHMTRTSGCDYLILQVSDRQLRSYLPDFDRLRFDTIIHLDHRKMPRFFPVFSPWKHIFRNRCRTMNFFSLPGYTNSCTFFAGITAPKDLLIFPWKITGTGSGSQKS